MAIIPTDDNNKTIQLVPDDNILDSGLVTLTWDHDVAIPINATMIEIHVELDNCLINLSKTTWTVTTSNMKCRLINSVQRHFSFEAWKYAFINITGLAGEVYYVIY